jgi:hypothetical protein
MANREQHVPVEAVGDGEAASDGATCSIQAERKLSSQPERERTSWTWARKSLTEAW